MIFFRRGDLHARVVVAYHTQDGRISHNLLGIRHAHIRGGLIIIRSQLNFEAQCFQRALELFQG